MNGEVTCPVCQSTAYAQADYALNRVFYECPVCGRFQLCAHGSTGIDENRLASYLFYHCFSHKGNTEYRYHTLLNKDICDEYRTAFDNGDITHGRPVHMDAEIVEAWYPKTFSERVDHILLYLSEHMAHMGQFISFNYQESLSLMFIDRKENIPKAIPFVDTLEKRRSREDYGNELKYMLNWLSEDSYVEHHFGTTEDTYLKLRLTPKGYSRVDELQKYRASGRNVLVAMKFGDDTKTLREAIREGIRKADYQAIFIDEVQHNEFITPELLKYIRDSKFVVVDLTHQNNGAYFEEGYAMGLGKPVIQLCKKDIKLHFDIAQKNTIIWETEDDIPERLYNRIKATID
nr:hypothetical protein [Acutalibacter muris]